MYNNWLTIGNFTIHGYGVMIAIGILLAFWLGEKQAKKYGLNPNEVDNLVFVCLISGYFFSKLLFCLTNWNDFIQDPLTYLGSSGWVVYGGILGGIFGAWLWCRYKKLDFMGYVNLLFPEVALAQAFGRIGCFFAGCCYGKVTDSKFSLVFPAGSEAPAGVRLIPTQLISSFGDFVLFYILYTIYKDSSRRNETAAWYLILYSAGRFVVEFFRGDTIRGFIGVLSTSQFISIFTAAAGVILLLMSRTRTENQKKTVLMEGTLDKSVTEEKKQEVHDAINAQVEEISAGRKEGESSNENRNCE